jgi:hypothetical protein
MWDKRVVEKVDIEVGKFSVTCSWKGLMDGFDWMDTRVYGPHSDGGRQELWDELTSIRQCWPALWCIFGDFNTIRFPSERLGCSRFSSAM